MRLTPHDVRRARLRRGPLVAITAACCAALFGALLFPPLAPWLGPSHPAVALLASAALAGALAALWAARRVPAWSGADDTAWVIALVSLAIAAGAGPRALSVQGAFFAAALVTLATREPSGSLTVLASASIALMPVVRLLIVPRDVAPSAFAATAFGLAFVALTVQTRRLSRALHERDALLAERGRSARAQPVAIASTNSRAAAVGRVASALAEEARRSAEGSDQSWDALVERVRSSITMLTESAGVSASVRADLTGLAPPSNKIRINLPRIAQEAATQALRHAEPRSITVTIRRGEGGVVLELEDDGNAGESVRERRALASLRGRVAALGGTAEVRRGEGRWVTRVRLPCEQLN